MFSLFPSSTLSPLSSSRDATVVLKGVHALATPIVTAATGRFIALPITGVREYNVHPSFKTPLRRPPPPPHNLRHPSRSWLSLQEKKGSESNAFTRHTKRVSSFLTFTLYVLTPCRNEVVSTAHEQF